MTHPVANQPPPRVDVDEFGLNRPLVDGVAHYDAEWALGDLREAGKLVGSAAFQRDAELANRHEPRLHTHDRWGNRSDEVEYDESYHRIIASTVAEAFVAARLGTDRGRLYGVLASGTDARAILDRH